MLDLLMLGTMATSFLQLDKYAEVWYQEPSVKKLDFLRLMKSKDYGQVEVGQAKKLVIL